MSVDILRASEGSVISRVASQGAEVFAISSSEPVPVGPLVCNIGVDVGLRYNLLEHFCFKRLSEVQVDLLLLGAVVAYADRRIKRHRANQWSREITVEMPVHAVTNWKRPKVISKLKSVLEYLTGDTWHFNFVGRKSPDPFLISQTLLPLQQGNFKVMPFSHGLDSFCEAKKFTLDSSVNKLAHVTWWNSSMNHSGVDRLFTRNQHIHIKLPIKLKVGTHAEPTFRTRSFMFFIGAAITAMQLGSSKVSIAENGQGSIGPALVPFGIEWPHRGCHPGYTALLSDFISELFGESIFFEHPNIGRTKGEMLNELKANSLLDNWHLTISCARDQRQANMHGHRVHCGICCGCLLRRMALNTIGIKEEGYYFNNLSEESLQASLHLEARRVIGVNDRNIAYTAVGEMNRLANLPSNGRFDEVCESIPEVSGEVVKRVVKAHASEWKNYLLSLGDKSWISKLCKQEVS